MTALEMPDGFFQTIRYVHSRHHGQKQILLPLFSIHFAPQCVHLQQLLNGMLSAIDSYIQRAIQLASRVHPS